MGDETAEKKTKLEQAIKDKALEEVRAAWQHCRSQLTIAIENFLESCGVKRSYVGDSLLIRGTGTPEQKVVEAIVSNWRNSTSNPFQLAGPLEVLIQRKEQQLVREILKATEAIQQLEARVDHVEYDQGGRGL